MPGSSSVSRKLKSFIPGRSNRNTRATTPASPIAGSSSTSDAVILSSSSRVKKTKSSAPIKNAVNNSPRTSLEKPEKPDVFWQAFGRVGSQLDALGRRRNVTYSPSGGLRATLTSHPAVPNVLFEAHAQELEEAAQAKDAKTVSRIMRGIEGAQTPEDGSLDVWDKYDAGRNAFSTACKNGDLPTAKAILSAPPSDVRPNDFCVDQELIETRKGFAHRTEPVNEKTSRLNLTKFLLETGKTDPDTRSSVLHYADCYGDLEQAEILRNFKQR